MSGTHRAMQGAVSWPLAGTPVVADVQSPGFLPVTEEALSTIVQRLVPALPPPTKSSFLVPISMVFLLLRVTWTFWSFSTPRLVPLIAISVFPACYDRGPFPWIFSSRPLKK